jgi:putative ABC transport system permease protein
MAGFDRLRRYLRLPSRSARRIVRDIEDELQLQIDLRADALEREGYAPADARAEARRRFGDLDDATRYCAAVDRDAERRRRGGDWWSELRQDASHTFRILRRTPGFAAASVLTLALATGASTAVYGVLHAYLVRPMPFPEADRLVSVLGAPTLDRFPNAPSLRGVDWTSVDSLFAVTVAWDLDGFTLLGRQHAENVTGAWVSPGYFQALSVSPAIGRRFLAEEYRAPAPVAIISHALWLRRFAADPGVIGSTVTMHSTDRPDAATMVTIVGVLSRDFWPIQWRESDVLRPLPPSSDWMPALALLHPGASRLATQRRLDAVVRAQIGGQVDSAWHMALVSPLERHSARARPVLLAVLGAALFMLLAACASVAGALVSRTASRRSELAVRLALGGSRWRIVRQLLTESAVLATLAGALGLLVAYALLDAAGPLIERQLGTRAPGGAGTLVPTASIMMLSIAVSGVAGIALGLVPALTFLRTDRTGGSAALLGIGRSTSARGGAARVRRVLIAGQVTVAMVLLFGAGLMFRTIARMQSLELGFRVDGVMTGSLLLPASRYADSASKRLVMDRVLARVVEAEGVRAAALVYPAPFGTAWRFPVLVEGGGSDEASAPQTTVFTVSPGYFNAMDVRLRAGRTFRQTDDQAAPLVVVISEALARRVAPGGDAIGRRIRVRVPHVASFDDRDDRPWRTVIGVVTDTEKEFAANTPPDVYVPYAQNPRSLQSLVVRTDRPEATVFDPVRRAVSGVDPELALSFVQSMSDVIAAQGGQRRGLTVLLGAFAAFALGLSALALYASLSYTVVQRRAELAVRMALGAGARPILRLVVAEGVATAGVGVAGGAAASLALGRVLRNQVYGVATTDLLTLASIAAVLLVAVIAACIAPALRAVRTDPALVLRE